MPDHIYKRIELTGTSTKNIEDAIEKAVKKAAATVRNMRWFEVTEIRGHIDDGDVERWQVCVKVGFTLED